MPESKLVFAAALSTLLLASCGSRDLTAAENNAADAETNALNSATPSDPGPPNGSAEPGDDTVPPPDAVSHPNGFLPYGEDEPAPAAPAPDAAGPPGSKAPATEDEYIRNKQAGS